METTLPIALGVIDRRPYYRCCRCNLVQFLQPSHLCRRCGRTLRSALPLAEPSDPTPVDEGASLENLPDRLQILMLGLGWTQKTIAERARVNRATFSRVLHRWRRVQPTIHWLEKLSDGFAVPIAYLLRPCNGNFFNEVRSEAPRLQPAQLEFLAHAVALLAKNRRQGREAIERFLRKPRVRR